MKGVSQVKITFEAIQNQSGWIQADYKDGLHEGCIRFEMSDAIDVRDDIVAEALAALFGQYYDTIELALKVSNKTKKQIEARTGAQLICKVGMLFWNINKMMRQDIKTLNFNGDLSNLSALALTPGEVNKVSLDFGQESIRMYEMFDRWNSRIVKTNVMATHFPKITSDYYMIGSILYKDYFNTTYMITGLQLNPLTFNMTKIEAEQAIAGMINLPHSLGLTVVGHTKIACRHWSNILESAISSVKLSEPHVSSLQRLLVEIENERNYLGLRIHSRDLQPTQIVWGSDARLDFIALYILKHGGREKAEKLVRDIPVSAEALVAQCDFNFYDRFYPGAFYFMSWSFREAVQKVLEKNEILFYSEADWQNFLYVKDWIANTRKDVIQIGR